VDRIVFLRRDRPALIHRVTADVEDSTHHTFADGHGNGRAGIDHLITALETFGAGHRDGPDTSVTEMLLHFECQLDGLVSNCVVNGQRLVDARECVGEFDVHHRTDDLNDLASIHRLIPGFVLDQLLASWPPAISRSSWVIVP